MARFSCHMCDCARSFASVNCPRMVACAPHQYANAGTLHETTHKVPAKSRLPQIAAGAGTVLEVAVVVADKTDSHLHQQESLSRPMRQCFLDRCGSMRATFYGKPFKKGTGTQSGGSNGNALFWCGHAERAGTQMQKKDGRGGQTRTGNPSLPKRVRYQLRHFPSYNGIYHIWFK